MMYDFSAVPAASKDESIRAWSVEQAIEAISRADWDKEVPLERLMKTAERIDKFIRTGESE